MKKILYPVIWLVKQTKLLSAVAMRLTQLTGKSRYRIHPKHLIKYETPWYLKQMKKKDVVLDLGCSNGQHTIRIARKVKKVVGLDRDEKQLQIAKSLIKDKGLTNIRLIKTNLEDKFPVKSNSFDKILALDIMEHIKNQKLFLREIKRVLKSGGKAFIAIPNSKTGWKKLQKMVGLNYYADPDHKIEYSLGEAKNILTKFGFKISSIKPVVYDTPWTGVIDLIGGIHLGLYKRMALWKQRKVKDSLQNSTGFRVVVVK